MRDVPEVLAARIESGAARLCHAWIVTLADDSRLGFTDHDEDLIVEGVICRAACGWTAGAAHQELGLDPGLASAQGVLDVQGPVEADIRAGRWDGSRIEMWRLDWAEPDLRVRIGGGQVRRMVMAGERLTLELEGQAARLDRVVGRSFSRLCDAALGDARCGVDLEAYPGQTCDRRFERCRDRFGNAANFRGFPDMPGDDFLFARPGAGGRHDGGSRR
ncbi:MAG TPA: DUF2163 domain-containing protein [Brevundimonas sp.]|jgi:hypothetical protein|uniref:baseplate hub domain-containing protein n=1 Tax=Brevundimonas sp. TaxID=1871086 RepID=UPI002BE0B725|nr:DUF2163 domain-containing protein [Brevundimonas sp.]HRH19450.1 DUF2163 domain-containing protein [Brevundimonas sp.]